MTKHSKRGKHPKAQKGAEMQEKYRLYGVSGDPPNLKYDLISIIGIENGKVAFTSNDEFTEQLLSRFRSPLDGGTDISIDDPPEKYFKGLEARFETASRVVLEKTGKD